MIHISHNIQDALTHMGEKNYGLDCGISSLNNLIRGLRGGNLILVAGRASMGKSSIMMDMGLHVSKTDPALLVSMEMPFDELQQRAACNLADINFHSAMSGHIERDEKELLLATKEEIEKRKLYVVDGSWRVYPDWFKDKATGEIPKDSLKHLIIRSVKDEGVKVVFIDHLQYINSIMSKADTEAIRLHEVTQMLHELTVDYDIPIVLLSQLRRPKEEQTKTEARPTMEQVRNSGQVEEDCNIVCLLYRPEYYRSNHEVDMFANHVENDAEIIVAKNRGGPTGTLRVVFNSYSMSFKDKENDLGF